MPYSSSLSDAEWEILEPLLREILPQKKRTRPSNWSQREIMDGILYQLKNGCNWQDLPRDLPPYSTVYWHYKQWREAGVFDQLMEILHGEVRVQVKKKRQWTTLIIIDSQAVKNTCNASAASNGFCFYGAFWVRRFLPKSRLTNALMELKDIWLSIVWDSPFLPIVLVLIYLMIGA